MGEDKCEHVLNYEETHCTICLKPTWQIAHDTGLDKITELKKRLDLIDTIATSTAIGTDTFPKRIEKLEKTLQEVWDWKKHHNENQYIPLKIQTNINKTKLISDDLSMAGHLMDYIKLKNTLMEHIKKEITTPMRFDL